MPKYSIKIGEIHLSADRPITQDDQQRAREWMGSGRVRIIIIEAEDGTEMYAELTVDGH